MTMFGCIYQLWDWLEAPPLFNGPNMDAKKLHQLQQQQQQQHQKKIPLAYQTNINDYRTASHSPVFHQQQQQNYHLHHLNAGVYQQSPTSNSSSGPLTPIDIQPQASKLLLKHHMSNTSSSSQHSSPYHQQYADSGGEQLYQSPPERTYLAAAGRLQSTSQHNPASALQQQYQQLQQAKMQMQLQTQSEAVQQQQRTFALRQQINPPVPQGHYHMSQSSSLMSTATMHQQQQQQQSPATLQRAPPSTLNLSTQFQPAAGPLKVNNQQKQTGQQHQYQQKQHQDSNHYGQQQQQLQIQLQLQHQQQLQQQHQLQQQQQQQQQHQHQRLKAELQTPGGTEHSPVYIQQNHPGHVMNQACQTQISAVKAATGSVVLKTPSSEDSASKSPAHAPLDRKKSAGSIQALKSPITKRPASSTVSISGWLYKQGSDGLKVWRKRWFVLAEYCLYYYKSPEEEKLLGSILLPSYRVSACLPEDRIYRKFAFKCEHTNMRTYWLAAETAESMMQWVRALTAATMMQAPSSGESDQTSQPSASSSLNRSGENSDSGIHTLQSQQSKMSLTQGPATPASENANVQSASSSNSGGGVGGGAQPLYANAPPKPRRINDGGYSSPSPEHSIDNERNKQQQLNRSGGVMSPTMQQQQQQQQQQQLYQQQASRSKQQHAIYDARTGSVTSTLRLQQNQHQQQQQYHDNLNSQFQQQLQLAMADEYGQASPTSAAQQYMDMEEQLLILQQQQQQRSAAPEEIYGERDLHMQKLMQQRYGGSYMNAERRTPDAYGRSKNRVFSDYEDIYNLSQGQMLMQDAASSAAAASYRRPLSPPSYESNKHVPAMPTIPSRYTPNHLEATSSADVLGDNLNLRSRSATANIVRPHSADFLEYEARSDAIASHSVGAATAHTVKSDAMRTPRPKSSLDINRTPDSVYYSEASYAEKMRKSALYLQHPATGSTAQPQQPSAALHRAGANDIYGTAASSGMNTIGYENPYERIYKRGDMFADNKGAASMPRMSRSMGGVAHAAAMRSALTQQQQSERDAQQQQEQYYQTAAAVSSQQQQQQQQQQYLQQNEQFLRSASARLPKRGNFDDDYIMDGNHAAVATAATTATTSHQDGERKREESMKRLLEWKQRMLQSPLTRKGVQQTIAGGPGSNMTAMSKLGSNPNILLASTTVASGKHHAKLSAGGANTLVGGVSGIQRSRSETHANGPTTGGYNSYSSDDEASISVRNVRNLPQSNLTVKPDPADPYPEQTLENYDQMNKLTNSYYGTAHDMKYAKTTSLTDKGGDGAYFGNNGIMLASSTPLHPSSNGAIDDYYGMNGETTGSIVGMAGGMNGGSIYDIHQGGGYQAQVYPMRRAGSRAEIDILERETSTQMRNLDVSAGDLLSRTHEELVLLLIQLRRQNSNTARAIEQCCTDIHDVQNRLRTAQGLSRAESIQRLDYLKQHLLDLERQYEKSKPLVNLVDNMVKLGSLYRTNDVNGQRQPQQPLPEAITLDRLEFNQHIQEQRMLQEEQKQWDRLSPNQTELQSKVQQLYYLDQLLQEESGTLQNLQRDKEDLERALGGIRARIHDASSQPLAVEAAKKEQHMLERELSRVHQLLAENSKKLEQTVAGNARLEQELLILRQKLQLSRNTRDSQGLFVSDTYTNNTTAMLESELKRVQTLVGDMQRQRQELSAAVRQLTENSTRLYQEIGNKQGANVSNGGTPTGTGGHIKKRSNSMCWVETDLDSMLSVDRTLSDSTLNLSTPLYVDTSSANVTSANLMNSTNSSKYSEYNTSAETLGNGNGNNRRERNQYRYNDSSDNVETSGVDSDGFLETNPFAALTNQEKQEIKTVRIVKRESERRQRDRERSGLSNSTLNLDQVLEEEHQLALLQASGGLAGVTNGYAEVFQPVSEATRSKSLPRPSYAEPPKSRHHRHRHQSGNYNEQLKSTTNSSSHQTLPTPSKYSDYYTDNTDKNSNYADTTTRNGHNSSQTITNGSVVKEHLNPLANAYFAKQQAHQSQSHSQSRNSSQAALRQRTDSQLSLNKSLTDLSAGTVFQSEAARQIINELSAGSASEDTEKVVEKVPAQYKHRRAVPREKRRHYTAPNNVNVKAMENMQAENDMNRNNTNWRARDDLDMEVALRPRINAPDVVRSALGHGEKISENTIDNLLLAPNKIVIPERYIPETAPELSPEEKKRRQEKVESIKKMLAETPISTANETTNLPPSKINAEKKQREHLLQLNQILAQQVMQMSKIVAEKAMSKVNEMNATSADEDQAEQDVNDYEEEDYEEDVERHSESPAASLPIFQQRDNFFT